MKASRLASLLLAILVLPVAAQEWSAPVRGSWVQAGAAAPGDVVLYGNGTRCEIVVEPEAHSAILRAATVLAGDIERITGYRPPVTSTGTEGATQIRIVVLGGNSAVPSGIRKADLVGQWEAYQILTVGRDVWLVGSNFRGAAFAAYTLCERLGVDPLYLWTGYVPEKHDPLVVKRTDFFSGPPTFRYRGFFHDDEDILPRPYGDNGYPLQSGTVPLVWYERFFETALRLRMNQVAPYVRVQRPFEVQKTASDWGLYYTSHHYDTVLSNPWGFKRFGLGEARRAGADWDWFTNKEGMLNFWRGGVLENRELDAIWPVGMRGTQDTSYRFPAGMTSEEKGKVFRDVIDAQVKMVKDLLPQDKLPIFHFTLYGEMLRNYQQGSFDFPEDVILVWDDNGDAVMRGLPEQLGKWKHGVYYHLAFLDGREAPSRSKQLHHTVTPMRIEEEFRKIVASGATEYMLVNVSEMREYVMGARMIAEICWDASAAFAEPNAADRYVNWWCREYFGNSAAPEAAAAYQHYYQLLPNSDAIGYGNGKVHGALGSLVKKFRGEAFAPAAAATLPTLKAHSEGYHAAFAVVESAGRKMTPAGKQFFFENCALGMLFDWRPTEAAILLVEAMSEPDLDKAWRMCKEAREPLEKLELDALWAEHPPFQGWYAATWIRPHRSVHNAHRPYSELRAFLTSEGRNM